MQTPTKSVYMWPDSNEKRPVNLRSIIEENVSSKVPTLIYSKARHRSSRVTAFVYLGVCVLLVYDKVDSPVGANKRTT